jgi:hypothetical protein
VRAESRERIDARCGADLLMAVTKQKFCHIEQWMLHIVVPDRSSELVKVTL